MIFTAEEVEGGSGIRARLTLELESPFVFIERYELALPEDESLQDDFSNRWTRLPELPVRPQLENETAVSSDPQAAMGPAHGTVSSSGRMDTRTALSRVFTLVKITEQAFDLPRRDP